jgi:hypothetical protein
MEGRRVRRLLRGQVPDGVRPPRSEERGFLMAALAATVAVMVIFSTLAFQEWADVLRRDNEAEMMFRAKDIVRSIQRYRRDHGGVGPQKLEDLMEPGPRGQYYLRKMWKDPLMTNGKWGLLYIGPGGQIVDPNAPIVTPGLEGGTPGIPQREKFSVFDRGRDEGGTPDSEAKPAGPGSSTTPTGPGTEGRPAGHPISADDPSADPNAGGKQMSGLPIAGVKSLCKEHPFRVYNGLTEYSEWRFTFLDLETPAVPGGRGTGARGTGAPATPGGFGKGKGRSLRR